MGTVPFVMASCGLRPTATGNAGRDAVFARALLACRNHVVVAQIEGDGQGH